MTDESNPNRTVFRPSPLHQHRSGREVGNVDSIRANPVTFDGGARESLGSLDLASRNDDIPQPSKKASVRNPMMVGAAGLLALAAGLRSGRVRLGVQAIRDRAAREIERFERTTASADYPEPIKQRALYALCATIDDVVQHIPGIGQAAFEYAQMSFLVVRFNDKSAGDRFWTLTADMLQSPAQYENLIELYHACLAAGFEGKHREDPRELERNATRLYAAIPHVRPLSNIELSPHWRGVVQPRRRVGFWSIIALVAGGACAGLIVMFVVLRLVLYANGGGTSETVSEINPTTKLNMPRTGPPPPASSQLQTLEQFLAPEIAAHKVVVEEDGSTVRVRTTDGEMFASGSDRLEPDRVALVGRIGAAIQAQDAGRSNPGDVTVEGYTDSDKPTKALEFPDNLSLSQARAETVAKLVQPQLHSSQRVVTQAFGDADPIASNSTPEGKSLNRRVEIVVPRVT